MMHIPLASYGIYPIDHLIHSLRSQSSDIENLSFATLEKSGTMSGRDHPNIAGYRAKVSRSSSVYSKALFYDPLSDYAFG